jgi:TolB protein
MDAEGFNLRRLSTPSRYVDAPAWNPSKLYSEIAYSFRAENGRLHVAVLTLPDGPSRVLTDDEASCESPSWAPNGRHLVFSCETGTGWQLFVSDREGRGRHPITSGPGNNVQPDWGP